MEIQRFLNRLLRQSASKVVHGSSHRTDHRCLCKLLRMLAVFALLQQVKTSWWKRPQYKTFILTSALVKIESSATKKIQNFLKQ
jgi:hypothetical protein